VHLKEEELVMFSKIESASIRMTNLIEDLIQYSQVTGHLLQKETVDLNQNIKQVIDDLELIIAQKNALIQIQPLPTVKGYDRQLQQLFQNLLSNALKYSKADVVPEITITSGSINEGGKSYHVIEVKDNGIGFDQKYANRIFEIFTRLHNKNEYTGNGIGLSIVKKIIENHGGRISVESKPGEGSAFKVYLPFE
jgi:signal transduction histidine kinase